MQVLIAAMGFLVTALVVAGMILMAPANTEPDVAGPHGDVEAEAEAGASLPAPA